MRKSKQYKRLTYILVALCAITAILAVLLLIGYRMLSDAKALHSRDQAVMRENTRTAYVATADIAEGEELLDGVNVQAQSVYSGMDSSLYMSAEDLGYKALLPIAQGTAVYKNMVITNDISADTREYEMSVVTLMTNQKNYDTVDIRILFPDGSDYLLLPKKTVHNLSLRGNVFFTDLSEEEILRMSSAIVDAYTHPGTKIYTTKYLSSAGQDAATPNYLVKDNVIDLLHNDPNVLDMAQETLNEAARMDLERRLSYISDDARGGITDGQQLSEDARQEALDAAEENGVYDEEGGNYVDLNELINQQNQPVEVTDEYVDNGENVIVEEDGQYVEGTEYTEDDVTIRNTDEEFLQN